MARRPIDWVSNPVPVALRSQWGAADDDIPPPYQLRRQKMVYAVGRWPEGAALPPLPAGLSPGPERMGLIGVFDAAEGRGLAPLRVFFGAIVVRETHAHDRTDAAYLFHGVAEGPHVDRLRRYINSNYQAAQVGLSGDEGLWRANAGGAGWQISLDLRRQDSAPRLESGTNYYISNVGEVLCGFSVTFFISNGAATPLGLSFNGPETHPFAVLRGLELEAGMVISDMSMTYGLPFPLALATPQTASTMSGSHEADGVTTSVLDILARVGRAVAIVDDQGRILYANGEAEAILARIAGGAPTRLRPPEDVYPGRPDASPRQVDGNMLSFPGNDGQRVYARVMPISLRLNDRPALMALFEDPSAPVSFDPVPLLRLYGLTQAEARLAALVGQGQRPAEAAQTCGITLSSARSSLKLVFSKLGIGRQSELARFVTRLERV